MAACPTHKRHKHWTHICLCGVQRVIYCNYVAGGVNVGDAAIFLLDKEKYVARHRQIHRIKCLHVCAVVCDQEWWLL